mmetsp:Transcript_47101/g.156126  ORF Transcript_47101/g.156126 Transcript_47101/m.156126 type:complete len:209 (+) Transcript_47101:248-874(+)
MHHAVVVHHRAVALAEGQSQPPPRLLEHRVPRRQSALHLGVPAVDVAHARRRPRRQAVEVVVPYARERLLVERVDRQDWPGSLEVPASRRVDGSVAKHDAAQRGEGGWVRVSQPVRGGKAVEIGGGAWRAEGDESWGCGPAGGAEGPLAQRRSGKDGQRWGAAECGQSRLLTRPQANLVRRISGRRAPEPSGAGLAMLKSWRPGGVAW